jgi:hypothetical protein
MVGERFAAHAHLGAFERLGHRLEAAAGRRGGVSRGQPPFSEFGSYDA